MLKKVIIAGMLGGIVLIIWTFVVNVLFGFKSSLEMKQIPNERQVYEILKENIVDPGKYICNPELTAERPFPDGEPVFGVLYSGIGHESAGKLMLIELVVFFLAPIIGAWMLSQTSRRIMSSYPRKVLFFVAIGLLFALFTDLTNFDIGSYPIKDAILLAINNIIVWTLVGLAVAWRIKPEPTNSTNA